MSTNVDLSQESYDGSQINSAERFKVIRRKLVAGHSKLPIIGHSYWCIKKAWPEKLYPRKQDE